MTKELKLNENGETGCCPRFDPKAWDGKVVEWKNKRFIRDHVITILYIPINFGGAMTRLMKKTDRANTKTTENMCLSEHTSKWNMDLFLAVDKEIEDTENISFNGRFIFKVFDGDFKDTGKWGADFDEYIKERGYKKKKLYMWYTTCPKCAKKYGHNYVAFVAEIL